MAKTLFPKVAWTLIIAASDKSNVQPALRALSSISGHVDDIFIQLNAPKGKKISEEVRRAVSQFTNKIYDYEWKDNFVDARNDIFSKVDKTYDWIGWMDVDDIIDFPEQIWPVTRIMPQDVNCIHILYDYQKDQYGNVVVAHWSARIVRNNNSYHWKSSFDDDEVAVHETLVPRRSGPAVSNDEFKIIHMAEAGHHQQSLERNIRLLEGMAQRQAKKPRGVDPRILYYLGSHYFEAGRYNEATDMFIQYLKVSGWAEERAEAHIYMGKYMRMHSNFVGAKNAFLHALAENNKSPNAYYELGRLDTLEHRWDQAASWFEMAYRIKPSLTAMVQFKYEFELMTEYAQALANLGGKNLEKAYKLAQKAFKIRPADPAAKENRDFIEKLIKHRNVLRGTTRLIRELRDSGEDKEKMLPFLQNLPESVKDTPLVQNAFQEYMPPKKWPNKSIAIYCGYGPLGTWGPWSLNEGGVGGSEEAVVRMSQELASLGWQVTVYAMPGTKTGWYSSGGQRMEDKNKPASHTGHHYVEWRHYWEFNQKDEFDVLVVWRQPAFFDLEFKARRKYLWLHDVMPADELIKERIDNVTKVIYVSRYHSEREESDHVPKTKKLASGNGIAPSDFSALDDRGIKRNPRRCIYMSANERGLRILYDIWEDVLKEVPDAELVTYYGWHSFDAVNRDNPERMAWKASMQLRAKELGIADSVRIDQDKINEEIFKSGIFAYPCTFPEVNCITAQKAMAGGAVPVTSDYAVLKDIIKYGEQVPMHDFQKADIEKYKERLIWWLKNPDKQDRVRQEMMTWARKEFPWSQTAAQWDKEMS